MAGAASVADLGTEGGSPARTTPYAWYVALMLGMGFLLSIGDRYILGVVIEDVKRDLALTDTQLGILGGPSFVLLFLVASIPFGRLADSWNRKLIVSLGLAGWSLATVACGFANSFTQLLMARLAIGLGEASLMPCAMSLIVAYFSRDQLSRGLALYSIGASLGRFSAFVGGGFLLGWLSVQGGLHLQALGYFKPWQGVFMIAGAIGLGVALMFLLTVREPPRRGPPAGRGDFKAGLAFFWENRRAYLSIFVPFGMANGLAVVLAAWSVSFFLRRYELPVATTSALMGIIGLVIGTSANIAGGWLNDHVRKRGVAGPQPVVLAVVLAISAVCVCLFTVMPTVPLAIAVYCVAYFFITLSSPTALTGVQLPTPDRFRGVMSSLFLIVYSALGSGVGPLLVGIYGDYYFHSEKMLGPSIMMTAGTLALVGIPLALLGRRQFAAAVRANEPDKAPA